MHRVDAILQNLMYRETLQQIELCEQDRIFCKHTMTHLLDVARIAMIFNLKENLGIREDVIYAAALLHDIGRCQPDNQGAPHEVISTQIAENILIDCTYHQAERIIILEAISSHRDVTAIGQPNLSGILYRADKASRACYLCPVAQQCNWQDDKKNHSLVQ
ncbi:MAG: HD domain-containing protein [Lachnospiraceae bacterium]